MTTRQWRKRQLKPHAMGIVITHLAVQRILAESYGGSVSYSVEQLLFRKDKNINNKTLQVLLTFPGFSVTHCSIFGFGRVFIFSSHDCCY